MFETRPIVPVAQQSYLHSLKSSPVNPPFEHWLLQQLITESVAPIPSHVGAHGWTVYLWRKEERGERSGREGWKPAAAPSVGAAP